MHCPAHDDRNPSLTVKDDNGMVLVKCQSGCSQDAVISALKERGLWDDSSNGHRSDRVTKPKGLTVEQLAKAKHLSMDVLEKWGVHNVVTNGVTKVAMPYLGIDGSPTKNIRYRINLEEDRFRWEPNSKVILYGLQKLPEIARRGWGLLVEGEGDTITGWMSNVPTLGIPGKSNWQPEWAEPLTPDVIDWYVWIEPGAKDLAIRVGESMPNIRIIVATAPIKDINEALILGMDVAQLVDGLKKKAVSLNEYLAQEDEELLRTIEPVLKHPDPLQLVRKAMIEGGYGGDITKPLIIYIALTSRLLKLQSGAMVVHMLILGESSAGKNKAINAAKVLFPSEYVTEISAGSPRVLIYNEYETQHAGIIFGEADSLPAGEDSAPASAIRAMLQDGHLDYDVVVKDKETGKQTVDRIRKPGPTVLITTSTKSLGRQLMTRLFTLEISAEDDQLNEALDQIVKNHLEGISPPPKELVEYQRYLQSKAPWNVTVPFIKQIREGLPRKKVPPRLLRDLHRLISLIQTIAIIRHPHRDTDDKGRLVASLDDYQMAYELVNSMYINTVTGVTPSVTNIVEMVDTLKDADPPGKIGYSDLERELGIHRGQIMRDVKKAISRGWLIDQETKKGSRRDLILGDPIPSDEGLPTPEMVRHAVTRLTDSDHNVLWTI